MIARVALNEVAGTSSSPGIAPATSASVAPQRRCRRRIEGREQEERRGECDLAETAQDAACRSRLRPFCSAFRRGIEASDQPSAKTSTRRRRSQTGPRARPDSRARATTGRAPAQRRNSTRSGRSRTQRQTPSSRSARRSAKKPIHIATIQTNQIVAPSGRRSERGRQEALPRSCRTHPRDLAPLVLHLGTSRRRRRGSRCQCRHRGTGRARRRRGAARARRPRPWRGTAARSGAGRRAESRRSSAPQPRRSRAQRRDRGRPSKSHDSGSRNEKTMPWRTRKKAISKRHHMAHLLDYGASTCSRTSGTAGERDGACATRNAAISRVASRRCG